MRRIVWAYAVIFCCLGAPVEAAGIQLLDSDPGLAGAIWYPCAGEPKDVPLGSLAPPDDNLRLTGVKDCPITRTKLPLVIFSHGRGGWFGANNDTAEALADAGFVVAAINHPGDNGNDSSQSEALSVWASRPADMVRLLDFMLEDWKDRAAIDPARIGFFGFSKGGYTGLVLAGATLDFHRTASNCIDNTRFCEQIRNGDVPQNLLRDSRIKAAVLADPAPSVAFTKNTLAAIHIPLQVWRSELGARERGVDPIGVARVTNSLPGQPEIHIVPAGHFAFLPPCSPELAANLPRFCADAAGFNRSAFHREFDTSVVRFFREHLGSGAEAR
ncbi:hydrolase [Bradyrhizobium sp. BRP22]|uniref:alpha/beta hydrolase family protein n=1 Tax=Bradyrhizobium sp. BRP22 TaxID=2793821 RepID=UPI001CD55FB9|nr:hydrolase [Bradyrhizobium sp. BRP22]